MRGHGHHRASAVARKHVVGYPEWERFACERVFDMEPAPYATLDFGRRAVEIGAARGSLDVCPQCRGRRVVSTALVRRRKLRRGQRMLGRDNCVRRSHQRVGPRGEHIDRLRCARARALHFERDLGALGAPDPRLLHRHGAFGPLNTLCGQVGSELLGVLSDAENPLAERHAHHREAAALRLAVDDLLVSEDGAQLGAPVHTNLTLNREVFLEELQKDPLRPLDVTDVGGGELALPVVREAERAQLPFEVGYVRLRRLLGSRARVDSVLLCRQTEGVPSHRVQHVVVAHAPVARHDVRRRVALGVAHVQPRARRVREHVEHILLLLALAPQCSKGVVLVPVVLPLGLDCRVVVAALGGRDLLLGHGGGSAGRLHAHVLQLRAVNGRSPSHAASPRGHSRRLRQARK